MFIFYLEMMSTSGSTTRSRLKRFLEVGFKKAREFRLSGVNLSDVPVRFISDSAQKCPGNQFPLSVVFPGK
jgi:hypothetical protein